MNHGGLLGKNIPNSRSSSIRGLRRECLAGSPGGSASVAMNGGQSGWGEVEGNIRGAERHSTEGLENGLYFDWNGKPQDSIDYKIGSASEKPQLTPV